jgi:hypothetical protein
MELNKPRMRIFAQVVFVRPEPLPNSNVQTMAPEAQLGGKFRFSFSGLGPAECRSRNHVLELRVNGAALDLAIGGFIRQRPRLDEAPA